MSTSPEVVAVWTSSGHHLTHLDGSRVDMSEERRIDDVVADDWIHAPARSHLVREELVASDQSTADRRTDVVLL